MAKPVSFGPSQIVLSMVSESYKLIKTFHGLHNNSVNSISVSVDGQYALSISDDGSLAIFQIDPMRSVRLVHRVHPRQPVVAALCGCWSADNLQFFVGYADGRVWLFTNPAVST